MKSFETRVKAAYAKWSHRQKPKKTSRYSNEQVRVFRLIRDGLGKETGPIDAPLKLLLEKCPECRGQFRKTCSTCEGKALVETHYTDTPEIHQTRAIGYLGFPIIEKQKRSRPATH